MQNIATKLGALARLAFNCLHYLGLRASRKALGLQFQNLQRLSGEVLSVVGHARSKGGQFMGETVWMTCDSTDPQRAEFGPFRTREEAEIEARRLGFGFLLRYEHVRGENDASEEVRTIFVELPPPAEPQTTGRKFYTRCAACGEAASHEEAWLAEVWADIHEFEHSKHRVRLFEQTRGEGLKEIGNWREIA